MAAGTTLMVVNRRAGEGRRYALAESLRRALSPGHTEVVTDTAAALAGIERIACDPSAGVVVFGGDGTVNPLLGALADTGVALAVFPAGTVNDLARELDMPADVDAFADMVRAGRARPVDLIEVNGLPFAAYGSVGLGARTSAWAARTRRALSPLRRIAPLLQSPVNTAATILFDHEYRRELRIEGEGIDTTRVTSGVYVANLARLNGSIRLAADAAPDDGRLEAYVLKETRRLRLLATVLRVQVGGYIGAVDGAVLTLAARSLRLTVLDGTTVEAFGDGELLTRSSVLDFRVRPGALRAFARR